MYQALMPMWLIAQASIYQTKSDETLVSSWIDLIALAKSGATLRMVTLGKSLAPFRKGIVLVVTICSISDSASEAMALPERTA
jgi:hypothetical protein